MTQAQRCLIIYNELLRVGEMDASGAIELVRKAGQESITIRTVQRDLKAIYDTLENVGVESSRGQASRYFVNKAAKTYPTRESTNINAEKPKESSPKKRADAKTSELSKKAEQATLSNKIGSDAKQAAPTAPNHSDAVIASESDKKARGVKTLPEGFDKIGKNELKAQRIISENRKIRLSSEYAEEALELLKRNSTPDSSVKLTKNGNISLSLKKLKAKNIAQFIKRYSKQMELIK
jgi:hypothetical protein